MRRFEMFFSDTETPGRGPLHSYQAGTKFVHFLDKFPRVTDPVAFHSRWTCRGQKKRAPKQRPRVFGELRPSWESDTEDDDVDVYQRRSLHRNAETVYDVARDSNEANTYRYVSCLRKRPNSDGYLLVQFADGSKVRRESYLGITYIDSWGDYFHWKKTRRSGVFHQFPMKKVHNHLAKIYLFPHLNVPRDPYCDFP